MPFKAMVYSDKYFGDWRSSRYERRSVKMFVFSHLIALYIATCKSNAVVCWLLVGCLTSQHHASVSLLRQF